MEKVPGAGERLAGFTVKVVGLQKGAHHGHEHTGGRAVAAAVAKECRSLAVRAAEEVVVIAGDDERGPIREVEPVSRYCGRNLRQNTPLEIAQLHPGYAVVLSAIGKRRAETTRAGAGRGGWVLWFEQGSPRGASWAWTAGLRVRSQIITLFACAKVLLAEVPGSQADDWRIAPLSSTRANAEL